MGFAEQAGYAGNQPIGGATIAGRALDVPQPEMSRVLERLTTCNGSLHEAIAQLEARVGPVLNGPSSNENKSEGAIPKPVRCPLGAAIDRESDGVYEAERRVRALLDRLAI